MARRNTECNADGVKYASPVPLLVPLVSSSLLVVVLSLMASTTSVEAWVTTTTTTTTRLNRHHQHHAAIALPTTSRSETTILRMSAVNETSSSSSSSLPDFGKTTVEVDTIKLVKKKRKKEKKVDVEEQVVDNYDTKVGMEKNDNDNNNKISEKWRRTDLFGSSLVEQTMDELNNDADFQDTQDRIAKVGLAGISKEERTQRRRALDKLNVQPFAKFLTEQMMNKANKDDVDVDSSMTATATTEEPPIETEKKSIKPYRLERKTPTVLQINIGLYCNQACGHCHVESSPLRTEMMTAETAAQCLELLKSTPSIDTLDITGGAPELNDHFRFLVSTARAIRGKDLIIIDRCNLTVLQEPGQEDLVEFLKDHDVHVIASLPCYSEENVDTQRGGGVFERSIAALLALNEAGYGRNRDGEEEENDNDDDDDNNKRRRLQLDLVYNPLGAFLPPPQEKLQVQYQQQLADNFGILFDQLYTITNMPIKRFADFLHRRGELAEYMDLLVRNFNPDTVEELMCLNTINIGWDGKIYDCDFNQQLGYAIGVDSIHRGGKTVFDLNSLDELRDIQIRTDNHCFGCTAGMGSS